MATSAICTSPHPSGWGMPKGEFLRAFGADIFFDDQQGHCESAAAHVAAAHVPHGIVNKKAKS